ncbi:MAG TPA: IS630 family transposase, partial [Solirubrobacteraceae bacterium]|nr:IS630 family transposase [Solirubrobacteraceae bacterium]
CGRRACYAAVRPSSSRDVRFEFHPPIRSTDDGLDPNKLKMFREGISTLAPGKEIRTLFDTGPRRHESDLPDTDEVAVSYTDQTGKRSYEEKIDLDFGLYWDRATVARRGVHDIHKQLVGLLAGFDRKLAVDGEVGRITIEEVVVRPPEVFVRSLAHQEALALKRRAKAAQHFSTRQRAAILLASNVGNSVPQIAAMWMTDESHVRKVIHEFNERGMDSLDPDYRGGRARRITDSQRREIVAVAGARPDTQGVALTRWSLPRLADYLADEGVVQISPAHLGRMLAEAGLSFQRTRTWKASPDPDFEVKAARVLELCAAPPADGGAVIAFDQMGPLSLRPMAGAGWAVRKRPERQRATFHRRHGVRYVMGAYDVHDDRLRVRLRPRRRGQDNLAFMRQIRTAIPARRPIYWIQDNLSANWTPDIRAYAAANKIELVATPTYASYLNPVECHFFPISEFVVRNADYVDWDAFAWALARHVTHRNGPHRAKRIRTLEARHQIAA